MVSTTLAGVLLVLVALVARRFGNDLEEVSWRLLAIVMFLMPILSLLPKMEVTLPEPIRANGALEISSAHAGAIIPVAIAVHALVALALLIRLLLGLRAAERLRRAADPFGSVRVSSLLRVPVTAGLFKPVILLPLDARTWSDAKLAAVLAHEEAHVKRRDPLWRFIGRTAAAVCWFHPLAWLAAAGIERAAEEAADRAAVAVTGDRHSYAGIVIDFLRVMRTTPSRIMVAGILDGRPIARRIDTILATSPSRRSRRPARVLLTLLVAVMLFTTGGTSVDAESPPSALSIAPPEQQELAQEELLRKRDEIRDRLRKGLRENLQALFRTLSF